MEEIKTIIDTIFSDNEMRRLFADIILLDKESRATIIKFVSLFKEGEK